MRNVTRCYAENAIRAYFASMGTKIQIIPKIRIENQRNLPKSGDSMAESDFFFDFSPYYRHFFEKNIYLCTKFI